MKIKRKWLALFPVILLLGLGTAFWLWPRDRITLDSYYEIRIGMTLEDVEGILGCPGLDNKDWESARKRLISRVFRDKQGEFFILHEPEPLLEFDREDDQKTWIGQEGVIAIRFDQKRKVDIKYFEKIYPAPSFLDHLRAWLAR